MAKKTRRGRPPLPKNLVRSKIVRVMVNQVEYDNLTREARRLRWSVGTYARFLALNLTLTPQSVRALRARARAAR
jgi:hypothetical protein